MKFNQAVINRKEVIVILGCILFLCSALNALGRQARSHAKEIICLANMRLITERLINYTAENDDWLPGPNTTGFAVGAGQMPDPDASTPSQNMDWYSPLFGEELNFSTDPGEKTRQISNLRFRCPSNTEYYDYQYPQNTADSDSLPYLSYSAVLAFHMVSSRNSDIPSLSITDYNVYSRVQIPVDYSPKLSHIGPASEKVFLVEGARYYDRTADQLSFNSISYQTRGGNFMMMGPAIPGAGDPMVIEKTQDGQLIPDEAASRLSFRHNNCINGAFFDGHCVTMSAEEAVTNRYYFPTGTNVTPLAQFTQMGYDPAFKTGPLE